MNPRAQLHILQQPRKRLEAEAFSAGLAACGYTVHERIAAPTPDDVFLCWNRMGIAHTEAKRFEAAGARVIVAENGYLGSEWRGQRWFAMALGHHNGRGQWPVGGPERWDGWGVELAPMRPPVLEGGVLLAQRGIGEPALRAPDRWTEDAARSLRMRIRRHPGIGPAVPLEEDLRGVGVVATWSSGAAIQALTMGIHVIYGLHGWIGWPAATLIGAKVDATDRRLAMFRRLAWAMWSESEAAAGEPFRRLLQC